MHAHTHTHALHANSERRTRTPTQPHGTGLDVNGQSSVSVYGYVESSSECQHERDLLPVRITISLTSFEGKKKKHTLIERQFRSFVLHTLNKPAHLRSCIMLVFFTAFFFVSHLKFRKLDWNCPRREKRQCSRFFYLVFGRVFGSFSNGWQPHFEFRSYFTGSQSFDSMELIG